MLLYGPSATNNIIEENYLTNGYTRVYLFVGASFNQIRNNKMKMSGLGNFKPGAGDSYAGWITYHLYHINKFLIGGARRTITTSGFGIVRMTTRSIQTICSNRLLESESGTTSGNKIHSNTVHNHSGQIRVYRANVAIYDNLIYDNKYNMLLFSSGRVSHMDIYRNRFHNPPGIADHIFFNAWATAKDSDTEIYFYHNSLAGGRDAFLIAEFMPGYGMPKTYIVNNIISADRMFNTETTLSAKRDMGLFDYNWMGGASMGTRPWFNNSTNIVAWGRKVWSDASLPDFVLPSGSDARSAGIDLSRPFTIAGITYAALPRGAGYRLETDPQAAGPSPANPRRPETSQQPVTEDRHPR